MSSLRRRIIFKLGLSLCCLAAGGAALAAASPGAAATRSSTGGSRADTGAHLLGLVRRLAKRSIEGRVVVPTPLGFLTVSFYRGTVQSVAGRRLTLRLQTARASYRTVTLTIPGNAAVRDDGHRSRLSALRPGQLALVIITGNGTLVLARDPHSQGPHPARLSIRVRGNHLVNDAGEAIQLVGISRMTNNCVMSGPRAGVLYGPYDASSVAELKSWHVNAVRIVGNEDCWLGINGAPPATSGAPYRHAISEYVKELNAAGIYAIIDLHENAPGSQLSTIAQVMADADHAVAYWTSVADTFKADPAVILEPYNEPKITTSNSDTGDPWSCWLSGCQAQMYYPGRHQSVPESWQTAGMQQLVDAIRATGATNVISLSGLNMANDLSGLVGHLPNDPQHQLAATFHNYGQSDAQNEGCGPTCWNTVIASVAQRMPVITDELGQAACGTGYVSQYMDWADAHGISYLAWGWAPWGCANHAYGLITGWGAEPNSYGRVFYEHFASVASRGYRITR